MQRSWSKKRLTCLTYPPVKFVWNIFPPVHVHPVFPQLALEDPDQLVRVPGLVLRVHHGVGARADQHLHLASVLSAQPLADIDLPDFDGVGQKVSGVSLVQGIGAVGHAVIGHQHDVDLNQGKRMQI